MIIPDLNLLVYAYNPATTLHRLARPWWESALNGTEAVGIPWIVSAGFIRLMTHPRVLEEPMSVGAAIAAVQAWLAAGPVVALCPGERFPDLFFGLVERLGVGGNLTTDAQLAALAIENQAVLCSNDRDFVRFEGLRLRNPIA